MTVPSPGAAPLQYFALRSATMARRPAEGAGAPAMAFALRVASSSARWPGRGCAGTRGRSWDGWAARPEAAGWEVVGTGGAEASFSWRRCK